MANEEIIILKVQTDLKQPVQSIDELNKRVKLLRKTLKESPKEGTKAFDDLAKQISSKTGVSIEKAKKQIVEFQQTATKEIQKGSNALKSFNAELREIPASANSIQGLRNQVKLLDKEVSLLDLSTQEFVDKSQELKKTRNRLKELEEATGDARRSVGSYTESIKKAIKDSLSFSKTLAGVSKTIKVAFGFGAIRSGISTLTNVYNDVIEKNRETDAEIGKLARQTDNLKVSFSNLALKGVKLLIGPLTFAIGLVTKFFNFLSGTVPTIKEFSANSAELKGEIDGLNESFAKETAESQVLFTQLKKTNASQQDKKDIVDKINKQYGQYLPNLLTEKSLIEDIEAAQRAVNRALTESFTLKIQQATLNDTVTTKVNDQIKAFNDLKGSIKGLEKFSVTEFQEFTEAMNGGAEAAFNVSAVLNAYPWDVDRYAEDIAKVNPRLAEFAKVLNKAKSAGTNVEFTVELDDGTIRKSTQELDSFLNLAALRTKKFNAAIDDNADAVSIASARVADLTVRNKDFKASTSGAAEEVDLEKTKLQQLSDEQQRLTDVIKNAIADGVQPMASDLDSLLNVTSELIGVDKEFAKITESIDKQLANIAEGSLADYDEKINVLKDSQKDLNITSEDYADIQAKIALVESQRNTILDLINQNTTDLVNNQRSLNNEISDSEAQNTALQNAVNRIQGVTDATSAGADRIKSIESELAASIEQIKFNRLVQSKNAIKEELDALKIEKQKELELVGDNEQLKLAIEVKFNEQKRMLELEGLNFSAQILQKQLEDEKAKNAKSLEDTKITESKRQKEIQQGLSFVSQASSGVFQIISNVQQQAFDKQTEQLEQQQEAALKNAELIGASEAQKQAIKERFAKKEEALEKKQANKRKAIAVTQAIIQTALAVATALASSPPPASYALAAVAAALGAIQVGVIATQKFALGDLFDMNIRSGNNPKYAKGSYLANGAYHSQGGMPIVNPYTGQKVAEIEKGEGIVNRKTMSSRKQVTMTGTPYDIISSLNNMNGYGVAYPNARRLSYGRGGYSKVPKPKKLSYGFGGSFGVSSKVLKLQQGAVVAASATRDAQKIEKESGSSKLLNQILEELKLIQSTNETGFEGMTTTAEDLQVAAKLIQDEQNAS